MNKKNQGFLNISQSQIMKDKKAYYRIDDVAAYFFAFLIIGIGIAAAIYGFYGQDIDVRGEEAKILNYKIYNVVRDLDAVNLEVFSNDFDVLGAAGIDKNVFNDGDYYYMINFTDGESEKIKFKGNLDYGVECDLELAELEKKASSVFAICHVVFEKVNNGAEIRIITASNHKGERI